MDQKITNRANQLLNDKEHGHELTWEKALRLAQEEAAERAQEAANARRERELLSKFQAEVVAAGVKPETAKTLASNHLDLPDLIQTHRVRFADPAKERAVKTAIRKLYAALGYGEPDLNPIDLESERKRKHQPWFSFPDRRKK